MSTYQNRPVTIVRAAQSGDAGFDASKTPQSLIRRDDEPNKNSELVVARSEVTPN